MKEPSSYLSIAKDYLDSADKVESQYVRSFLGYHAFESCCSAFISHMGDRVPLSHDKKISKFYELYKINSSRHKKLSMNTNISLFKNIRNKSLYPDAITLNDPSHYFSKEISDKIIRYSKFALKDIENRLNKF